MEPKRLTDDELRDIRARAELFKPSDLSDYKLIELYDWAHTQFIVQKLAGYTHVGMVVDELQGRRRMAADIPALLAHIRAQDAELARLRNDLAIIEQGCNSPWMTGAAFKDRVADIFASRALLDGADTPGEGGA